MYNRIINTMFYILYILELFGFQTSNIESLNLILNVESINISNRWKY